MQVLLIVGDGEMIICRLTPGGGMCTSFMIYYFRFLMLILVLVRSSLAGRVWTKVFF